uniref:Sulfotransferase n=1 Tax=Chelonoidis abingdonii TaxID=106734 RepID=A0A8C0GW30_CHEAB
MPENKHCCDPWGLLRKSRAGKEPGLRMPDGCSQRNTQWGHPFRVGCEPESASPSLYSIPHPMLPPFLALTTPAPEDPLLPLPGASSPNIYPAPQLHHSPPGTTWMQELLTLIHSDGDPRLAQSVPSWERVPWLEQTTAAGFLENRPCPWLISSHLPCSLFPISFHGSNAKVRGTPRTSVSLYHYSKMASFLEFQEDLGEFVELFSAGKGTSWWFPHIKGWLGLRDRLNFLLLTYEEMHQDLRGSVERICWFLGKQLDVRALDGVVKNTSFQAMKQNKMCNYSLGLENIMDQRVSPFLRKGGRGAGHFRMAQSQAFDQLDQEQMQDVSVRFPWDEPGLEPRSPGSPRPHPSPNPGVLVSVPGLCHSTAIWAHQRLCLSLPLCGMGPNPPSQALD